MFDRIVGYEEVKKELEEIIDIYRNKETYTLKGAKLPRGVLLYGEPGNGKTLFAKTFIKKFNRSVYSLSDYLEKHTRTHLAIQATFAKARKTPSVILIDELDKLFHLDDKSHDSHLALHQFLIDLDGVITNSDVFVIGIANSTKRIPKSLLRPGRFDRLIKLDYPALETRINLIDYYLEHVDFSISDSKEKIANMAIGMSNADIKTMINEASLLAIRNQSDVLSYEVIIEAIERIRFRNIRSYKQLDEESRYRGAIHEIGHAIVAHLSSKGGIERISIIQYGFMGGHVTRSNNERSYRSKDEFLETIAISMAGYVAEEMIFSSPSSLASDDLYSINQLLDDMITTYGFYGFEYIRRVRTKFYSDNHFTNLEKIKKNILVKQKAVVKKILLNHSDALEDIAQVLMKQDSMTKNQFELLLSQYTLTTSNNLYEGQSPCIQ